MGAKEEQQGKVISAVEQWVRLELQPLLGTRLRSSHLLCLLQPTMGTAEYAADISGRLASVLGSCSLICLPWSPCEKRKLFHAPRETRGKGP